MDVAKPRSPALSPFDYVTYTRPGAGPRCTLLDVDVDVDVVDLRAQADASMPASNNNVKLYNISNF